MKNTPRYRINTAVVNREEYDEDIAEAACHVGTGTIFNLCAFIGAWGVACLVSAVVQYGIVDVVKGWLGAIGG
ncbi:MAG: hypothetical protein ACOY4H_07710 [Thermodesulfobacteriota bacterium]